MEIPNYAECQSSFAQLYISLSLCHIRPVAMVYRPCSKRHIRANIGSTSDVKRSQNLEAEARATRPRPRPQLRGRGQDYEVEAEAKNNYEKVPNND